MVVRRIFASLLGLALVSLFLLAGCGSVKEKPAVTLDGAPTVSSATTAAQTTSSTPTRVSPSTPAPTPPPSSTTLPSPTPRPDASNLQLAIVDSSGDVVLVGYDGSGKKKLMASEQCPKPTKLVWSPTGDKLACLSPDLVEIDTGYRIRTLARYEVVVADLEGRILKKIGAVGSLVWSSSGQHMAFSVFTSVTPTVTYTYYVADADGNVASGLPGTEGNLIWSPDGSAVAYDDDSGGVAIYDTTAKKKRGLGNGIDRALAWALGGKALLVASELEEVVGQLGSRYKANLLELDGGNLTRVAELDNGSPFWVSPDGSKVVFPSWNALQAQSGAQLSILDLVTHAVTPIVDSVISYPGEIIPSTNVIFSHDGSLVYWIDVKASMDIYRARTDGTGTTMIAHLPGVLGARFSPDFTKLAFSVPGNPPTRWVSNLDGSDAMEIGPRSPAEWRPYPTPAGSSGDSGILGEAQLTQGIEFSTIIMPKKGSRSIVSSYGRMPGGQPGWIGHWLVDLNGSAKEFSKVSMPWEPGASIAAMSPDGNAVAYVATAGNDRFIGIMDADSGEKRDVAQGVPGSESFRSIVDWTEDNRLIFERTYSRGTYLWQMSPDGSNLEQLVPGSLSSRAGEEQVRGFPSRDGRYIIYDHTIYARSLGTGPSVGVGEQVPIVVTKTFSVEPVGDGSAYPLDGAPATIRFSVRTPIQSSWSPDGNSLLILRVQPSRALSLIAVAVQSRTETAILDDIRTLGTAPFSVDWRELLEPTTIGGRPAIVYPWGSILMRDGISKWSVGGRELGKEELIKVAEGLK